MHGNITEVLIPSECRQGDGRKRAHCFLHSLIGSENGGGKSFEVLKPSIKPFRKEAGSLSRMDSSGEKAAQGLKRESYSLLD